MAAKGASLTEGMREMSAFVVSKIHIDALVTAGLAFDRYGPLRWMTRDLTEEEQRTGYAEGEPWGPESVSIWRRLSRELTRDTAEQVGAMLWAENVRSVNHRYAEEEWEEVYTFERLPGTVNPIVVLKAISCYEYQSCEHPEWERSEARRFCDSLRKHMINHLPGMDDAAGWEINDRYVFGGKPIQLLRAERAS